MFIRTKLLDSDIIFHVASIERISNRIIFRDGGRHSAFIECKDEKEAGFCFENLSENFSLDNGVFSKIEDYEIFADYNSEGAKDFRPVKKRPV